MGNLQRIFFFRYLCYIILAWLYISQIFTISSFGKAAFFYQKLEEELSLSSQEIKKLEETVAALKRDQKALTQTLIKATEQEHILTEKFAKHEEALRQLLADEEQVLQEFQARQDTFIKILAILERMGSSALPAILAHGKNRQDALRSAMILGPSLANLQREVASFTRLISELQTLQKNIETEAKLAKKQQQALILERERIKLLLAAKAKLQQSSQIALSELQKKHSALVKKAKTFNELMDALAKEPPQKQAKMYQYLQQGLSFEAQKGKLLRPISGKVLHYYKKIPPKSFEGEAIEGISNAIIRAPANSRVIYAGPFRSYGKIVILDVGEGYHILLAGLDVIDITQGQFVLQGEPIGKLGSTNVNFALEILDRANFSSRKTTSLSPILYVELRKNGQTIDPAPWWQASSSKRM